MNPLPGEQQFDLAVIVPAYNRWEETADCLSRLLRDKFPLKSIFLIDDGSTDGTADRCRTQFPSVVILRGNGNLWWSGAINLGVSEALRRGANLILWLNNDNLVEPETISQLVEVYRQLPLRSVICAQNRSTVTGELEWRGEPPFWHPGPFDGEAYDEGGTCVPLKHPPGGRGVLFPASCFREVGMIDEKRFPHYWADHSFHYRAMGCGYHYYLAVMATVWNRPNPPRFEEREPFTLSWSWSYLTSRRSPMNVATLQRLWRDHLPRSEYRQIYRAYLGKTLYWIMTGMVARHKWLHVGVKTVKRFWRLFETLGTE